MENIMVAIVSFYALIKSLEKIYEYGVILYNKIIPPIITKSNIKKDFINLLLDDTYYFEYTSNTNIIVLEEPNNKWAAYDKKEGIFNKQIVCTFNIKDCESSYIAKQISIVCNKHKLKKPSRRFVRKLVSIYLKLTK